MRYLILTSLLSLAALPAVPATAESCSWHATELPRSSLTATDQVTDAAAGGWFVGGTDTNTQLRWRGDTVETLGNGTLNRVNSAGTAITGHTVVAKDGTATVLPAPAEYQGDVYATSINDRGDIVGHGYDPVTRLAEPILWPADAPGTYQQLPLPTGYDALAAVDIDNDGWILFSAHPAGYLVRSPWGTFTKLDGDGVTARRMRGDLVVGVMANADGTSSPVTWARPTGRVYQRFAATAVVTDREYVNNRGAVAAWAVKDGKAQILVTEYGGRQLTWLGGEYSSVRPVAVTDDGVVAAEAWYDNAQHAIAYRRTCPGPTNQPAPVSPSP